MTATVKTTFIHKWDSSIRFEYICKVTDRIENRKLHKKPVGQDINVRKFRKDHPWKLYLTNNYGEIVGVRYSIRTELI